MRVRAGRERVWDAVGTVDGPRHWWTTEVSGSAAAGSELRFGFAGLPEEMIMLVIASRRPVSVTWRCVAHNRDQGGPAPGSASNWLITARARVS